MIIIPLGLLVLAEPRNRLSQLYFMIASVINTSLLVVTRSRLTVRLMEVVLTTFSLCFNLFTLKTLRCKVYLRRMELLLLISMKLANWYSNDVIISYFGLYGDDRDEVGVFGFTYMKAMYLPIILQALLGAIGHVWFYTSFVARFHRHSTVVRSTTSRWI